jgi:hypothetical protein
MRRFLIASCLLVGSLLGTIALREPRYQKSFHRLTNSRGMPVRIVLFKPLVPPNSRTPGVVLAQPVNTPTEYGRALTLELVREGYEVLTFDWRGWEPNENRQFVRLGTPEILLLDVRAAVSYLRSLPDVDGERIAVAGHSAGGTLAIEAGTLDPKIIAVAAIGMEADVTPAAPRNLLWALGLYDEFRTPLRMLDYFHESSSTAAGINTTVGDFRRGTARRLGVSPTADHFTELQDRRLHREIVSWFNQATNKPPPTRGFWMQIRQWFLLLAWWATLLVAIWGQQGLVRIWSAPWAARIFPALSLGVIWGIAHTASADPLLRKNIIQLLLVATVVAGFLHRRQTSRSQPSPSIGRARRVLRVGVLVWLSILLTLLINNLASYYLQPAFLIWIPVFAIQHFLDLAYVYIFVYPSSLFFAPAPAGVLVPRLWVSLLFAAEIIAPGVLLGTITRSVLRRRRAEPPGRRRVPMLTMGILLGLFAVLGTIVVLRLQQGFLTADSALAAGRFLLRFAVLPVVLFLAMQRASRRPSSISP